ncbi:MAG TPA: hypothetical protein QGF58_09530 [Myxococcota bacterium]|nr:hypothetical protein [Myxococcota bacterium]
MELGPERAGPYLRALRAALETLAPHGDYVPLSEATALLEALDPALSADVVLPARAEPASGMPDFAWISRVVAEQHLASRGDDDTDLDDESIERALRLDPDLGQRMQARRRLHRFLRRNPILPSSRLIAALHRRKPTIDVTVTWDRLAADGRWRRVRCTVRWPSRHFLGPIELTEEGIFVPEGVVHLFSRHADVPILGLREQLAAGLGGQILRLSRGTIGPFWFPGIKLPRGVPEDLGSGLLLHLVSEILAEDVQESRHMDPLLPDESEDVVEGVGLFRQRRFAASPPVLAAVQDWGAATGMELQVSAI